MKNVAIVGLGGFAGAHHAAVQRLEEEGVCRLVATCDPGLERMESQIDRFQLRSRNVGLFASIEELLAKATDLDLVTLPTPIPLHAAQHRAVIESSIACYLEKPPTLWLPEFEEMVRVEANARFQTQVGFNFIGEPMKRGLKQRLDAGEFGNVEEATMLALWPRDAAYYGRNHWAGRAFVGDRPVMDSPTGNAVAHFVQDLIFWCSVEGLIPRLAEVKAVLARGHQIDHYDTAFIEATTAEGRVLRIGATHTGFERELDRQTIHCSRATLEIPNWKRIRVLRHDGISPVEEHTSPIPDNLALLCHNLREYFAYLDGERPRPTVPLTDCSAFVQLHHLVREAAGEIATFPESRLTRQDGKVSVDGLEEELDAFVSEGVWPTL